MAQLQAVGQPTALDSLFDGLVARIGQERAAQQRLDTQQQPAAQQQLAAQRQQSAQGRMPTTDGHTQRLLPIFTLAITIGLAGGSPHRQ